MKVIRLTAENIKRLRAVQIEPDGNVVVIAGRNGQGKTSVLDSIWFALGGGAATKETPRPIRDGEDEASVTLDLGDFTVTRTWKGEKTNLAVMSKDGAKYGSPQTFLDEKLGALSFDPLAFTQQDAKTQLATLLSLVELPFDPAELASKRRSIFDERTGQGRDLATAKAQLNRLAPFDADTPDEEVSSATVLTAQKEYETQRQARLVAEGGVDRAHDRVARAERALREAADELSNAKAEVLDAGLILDNVPDVVPMDFTEMLSKLESVNAAVRAKQDYRAVKDEVARCTAEVDARTAELAAIDQDKADALANADMPIEGLAFDDDGVTYNGVPFKQASAAEQLRVSIAMAMAMNPTIRVIRISDGSLLDSENMAIIADMAQEHDFQCWIERVDEGGGVGFTIEDGMVTGGE